MTQIPKLIFGTVLAGFRSSKIEESKIAAKMYEIFPKIV